LYNSFGQSSSRFGHEFSEFEINSKGQVRYANKSNYKQAELIRKEFQLGKVVLDQIKETIRSSGILDITDSKWPKSSEATGTHEMEIILEGKYLWLETRKLSSRNDVVGSDDPEGLSIFFSLSEDIKELLLTLVSVHFKSSPFG